MKKLLLENLELCLQEYTWQTPGNSDQQSHWFAVDSSLPAADKAGDEEIVYRH